MPTAKRISHIGEISTHLVGDDDTPNASPQSLGDEPDYEGLGDSYRIMRGDMEEKKQELAAEEEDTFPVVGEDDDSFADLFDPEPTQHNSSSNDAIIATNATTHR